MKYFNLNIHSIFIRPPSPGCHKLTILPGAGITHVCHHPWLSSHVLISKTMTTKETIQEADKTSYMKMGSIADDSKKRTRKSVNVA